MAEKRIFKYPLEITDTQEISMPAGAKILSVANQRGMLCLWALCDPKAKRDSRTIEIVGTGNPWDDRDSVFIGSVVIEPFVWHVFEFVG